MTLFELSKMQIEFFTADVYCDHCGDEHTRIVQPAVMQVSEKEVLLTGYCSSCGALYETKIHRDIFDLIHHSNSI